jgi:hypothetical protein
MLLPLTSSLRSKANQRYNLTAHPVMQSNNACHPGAFGNGIKQHPSPKRIRQLAQTTHLTPAHLAT